MARSITVQNEQEPFEEIFTQTGVGVQMQAVIEGGFAKAHKDAVAYAAAAARVHVKGEDDTKSMQAAAGIHAQVRELRLSVEKTRKALKDESLRTGQAIDAAARKIRAVTDPVEDAMQAAATYAERLRAERMKAIADKRIAELTALEWDYSSYDLQTMQDAQYARILKAAQDAYQDILAERERERVAQLAEAERHRIENERLRKELEVSRRKAEEEAKLRRAAEAQAEQQRKEAQQRAAVEKRAEQQRQREQARVAALGDIPKVKEFLTVIERLEYPKVKSNDVAGILATLASEIGRAVGKAQAAIENFSN